MPIPVKLTRVKCRTKNKGRPKYKYVLRWQADGKWQQETARTSDRKTANALRDQKFAEVNGLLPKPESAAPTFTWDDLREREVTHLRSKNRAEGTVEDYCRSIRALRENCGAAGPAGVSLSEIETFIANRRAAGIEPSTVNGDLRALRAVFERARKRGDLPGNPFADVEPLHEERKELRILSPEELLKLYDHFADRPVLQTFLMAALQTGARLRELVYLLADDIEPETGWLLVRDKTLPDGRRWRVKGRDSNRDVWLPPWLMERLTGLMLPHRPYVWSRFVVESRRPFTQPFDPEQFVDSIEWYVAQSAAAVGIPSWSCHDLRRTQQTHLMEQGWPDPICMAIAGHSSGATVLRKSYRRPKLRKMTHAAYQDVAGIFRDSGILTGDPLGDTRAAGLRDQAAEAVAG